VTAGVALLQQAWVVAQPQTPAATERPAAAPNNDSLKWDEPKQRLVRSSELYAAGKYRDALSEAEAALALQIKVHGRDQLNTAVGYGNLGLLQVEMGDFDPAEANLRQAVDIYRKLYGETHPFYAIGLQNLAACFRAHGTFNEARALLEQVVAIHRDEQGEFHIDTALALNNLAELNDELGDMAEARRCYEKAIEIQRTILGPTDADLATTLNNLGMLLLNRGDLDAAEKLLSESLAIRQKLFGLDHPLLATVYSGLGLLADTRGDRRTAQTHFERALAIRTEQFGEAHPATTESLNNLGMLLRDLDQYEDALRHCRRALELRREILGEKHPNTAVSATNLASVYWTMGKWSDALTAFAEARRIMGAHVSKTLPALGEHEQLEFLGQTHGPDLHAALSTAFLRSDDAAVIAATAAWVVNGKGVAVDALAQRALLMRRVNAQDDGLVRNLLAVRSQAAVLSMRVPTAAQRAEHRRELASLEQREKELTHRLGLRDGVSMQADSRLELDVVRRQIPDDAVLIEIVRCAVQTLTAASDRERGLPPRYGAWIIPPLDRGSIQFVDLGEAATLEAAIVDFQEALAESRSSLPLRGEAAGEALLREALEPIAARVLEPLRRKTDRKHWIVSPDADLWLVPWEAMPIAAGRYAVEDISFSYLNSGRQLAAPRSATAERPAIIVADPDFDGLSTAATSPDANKAPRPPRWQRLPFTVEESRGVASALAVLTGRPPTLWTGAEASEAKVKTAVGPSVLLFSTHGFFATDFLPDDEVARRLGPVNPLLRCGLVLAGVHRAETQRTEAAADDGYLTGIEISGLHLEGTRLVVLSACETAAGKVQVGEGVASLRQAFHLAGAQSVLASLWKVPDRETAELVGTFFEKLSAGGSRVDAWRRSQLEIIERRRRSSGVAHPLFWAAFSLTGERES
jgi:CHAT domain-containing protein/Tfp pilus assembly protein PilF